MLKSFLLLIAFIFSFSHLTKSQLDFQSCYNSEGVPTRCQPIVQSFSFEKEPSANSTCGSSPTGFCIRSVGLGQINNDCTGICDANDSINSHPPRFMTDFLQLNTWWQSDNSVDSQHTVMINLSLQSMVEINLISINFRSLIPSNFRILKSVDNGETYMDFHYFATSCINAYSIPDDQILSIDNETSVLCQAVNIPPYPGLITFFPLLGRPSTNDSTQGFSEALYQFMTATDIQVILTEHYIIPNLPEEDLGYYYAIEDFNVLGSCQCHGHASECNLDESTGSYSCVCQHNTTGQFCERCDDFYQDVPWQWATGRNVFECIACNCNGHSEECQFDPLVYEETNQTSGGVCMNCRNNRAGRQCDRCADFFYPIPEADNSFLCIACDCNLAGVIDNGDCAKDSSIESVSSGDCNCKLNTQGRTCEMCRPGFFNLSSENDVGCQACECNINGSQNLLCDPMTGMCRCKPNVIGNKCDQCRPGFYMSDPFSNEGCIPCNCNLGGSVSSQCDSSTGICLCRNGVRGSTCSEVENNFFYQGIDYLILEGEDATGVPRPIIITERQNRLFTGSGFYGVEEGVSVADFGSLTPPISGLYEITFRYSLQGALFWNSSTLTITASSEDPGEPANCGIVPEVVNSLSVEYTNWMMGTGLAIFETFCLQGGRSYQFTLSNFISGRSDNSAVLNIDSLVMIPVYSSQLAVFADIIIAREYRNCVGFYRSLAAEVSAPLSCQQTIFTVSTEIYNGATECDCDIIGTVMGSTCMEFGGQCMCLPDVRGRRCDECSPGFYNLTVSGCTSCSCDSSGSVSTLCQPMSGNCTCIENVAAPDCSSCIPDYWGFGTPEGCTRCECDLIGSAMSQCDELTGVCYCKDGVTGDSCDRCQNLTFGFSERGCSTCNCNSAGSTEENCHITTGQCTCTPTTTGRDCSRCITGFFNLQTTNPDGCQPCFCSGQSSICSSALGFYYAMVLSSFDSNATSPLQGWEPVNITSEFPVILDITPPISGREGVTLSANSGVYLEAPIEFIGNQLNSYMQYLHINLEPVVSGGAFNSVMDYDVILFGSNVMIGANFSQVESGFRVWFHESNWVYINSSSSLSSHEYQRALSSLTRILVSASYGVDVTLRMITLDTAVQLSDTNDTSESMEVTFVENCECPINYTGLSCEECYPGYTRSFFGTCELCQCNGFSINCDPDTGECLNCSGSTAGQFCDICKRGTYGDPTRGIECQPCPCPFTSVIGQFSDECVLLESGNVSCLNCPLGHTGLQCESCIPGYFGDPIGELGSPTSCSDCQCNGNIDYTDPNSCDRQSGVCMGCLYNTTGSQCEKCMDGFYGDAIIAKNCSECNCNLRGSLNSICDDITGQCSCLNNITGRQCDQCQDGFFGFETPSGCTSCNCHPLSSTNFQCNELGECSCLPGATGVSCDQCISGFFGLSATGCSACSCSLINSDSAICDASDGTCICSLGSTGGNCEQCLQNYFQTDSGCEVCPECYQEIEDIYNTSLQLLTSAENQTQNLTSESLNLIPFDDRVALYQAEISSLQDQASNLVTRQNDLLVVYNQALMDINVTLRNRLLQINSSLDDLKTRFTTIYVIAFSTQELMNNTAMEFTMASDLVRRIEMINLPSIRELTDMIQARSMEVNITTQEVESIYRNISAQLEYLRNVTNQVVYISASILDVIENLTAIQQELMEEVTVISSTYNIVDLQINDLNLNLSNHEWRIIKLLNRLRSISGSLVDVPNSSVIESLINYSNEMEAFVRDDILREITIQSRQFYELNEMFTANRIEFEDLFDTVFDIGENVSRLLILLQESYTEAALISNNTQTLFRNAEMIANNLENFNNETFLVGEEVANALMDIERVNNNSRLALAKSKRLEESFRNSSEYIQMAKETALNASNITAASIQALSQVETQNIVTSVNASLQAGIGALEAVASLSDNTSTVLEDLQSLSDGFAQREADLDLVESSNEQSAANRDAAKSALNQVREAFNSLETADQSKLELIRQLISDVHIKLNAANLTNVYEELRGRLTEQRNTREQLEEELNGMRADIEHLRRVNLTLPNSCNED